MSGIGLGPSEKWPSFTIQTIFLAVIVPFLVSGMANALLFMSLTLVILLFVLQALHRRFIMLWPVNVFTGKKTTHVDTYILRAVIAFSGLLLFLGMFSDMSTTDGIAWLNYLDKHLISLFTALIIVFTSSVLFWNFAGKYWIRRKVTEMLREDNPYIWRAACPRCGKQDRRYRYVIDQDKGKEVITCSNQECPFHNSITLDHSLAIAR